MFYTVTLPATLWFFDKAKTDDRILFIDARNIFTPIDRAHRAFSLAQIDNIAVISHLRRGKQEKFVRLIDDYFARGMENLTENKAKVEPVCRQLLDVLEENGGKQAVASLKDQWTGLKKLESGYSTYLGKDAGEPSVSKKNSAQHALRETFDPFFAGLHDGLKQLAKILRGHEKAQAEIARKAKKRVTVDRKTKALKAALEELQAEVKISESCFKHILWLQERFPKAEYEDVTGLCKLATPDEVKEQDYSLNPGRYVGVVIEEDGKTEEEFVEALLKMNDELSSLNEEAHSLECVISRNIQQISGEL
jgi:type I restriction enzyme M protein